MSADESGDTHAGPAESGDEESDHFVHAGAPSDAGAALFAVLAPRDTDARLRANAGLRALAGCEASAPGGVADMLAVAARSRKKREQDLLVVKESIGRRFLVVKRLRGESPGWAASWAREEFPERCCGDSGFETTRVQCFLRKARTYAKLVGGDQASSQACAQAQGRGAPGVCTMALPFSKRRRMHGAGGPGAMKGMVIADELFWWFVDTIENIKGRLPSALLLDAARIIAKDAKQFVAQQIQEGKVGAHATFDCPVLDHGWLRRWRNLYGISWRTPNLRFKCSRRMLTHRLRVFWANVLRVRFLHQALSQETGELVFEGFDQKPLWFTAASQEKTLAPRGAEKVAVKENMPMTRSRFTAMTRCRWPAPPSDGKEIAILFKAAGRGVRIRQTLRPPPGVLLQFQEKGSYRLEDVLEYLEWIADRTRVAGPAQPSDAPAPASSQGPAPASGQRRVVYLLDWFAPHLDPAIDDVVHSLGHAVLRIGGHLTGLVQVEDTHCHGPMTRIYKQRESREAYEQLLVRPDQLPSTSRQTVMDRAFDAWNQVNHLVATRGFVSNGITNALDGSEDGLLRTEVAEFWVAVDMPAVRLRAKEEVERAIADGSVVCFEGYTALLEKYDDHDALVEGQEAFGVDIRADDSVDSGAETVDGMDIGDGDGAGLEPSASGVEPCAPHVSPIAAGVELREADMTTPRKAEPSTPGLEPSAPGLEPSTPGSAPSAFGTPISTKEGLKTPLQKKRSTTAAALEAVLSAGGDPELERQLRSRLRSLEAACARIDSPARLHVHDMLLERRQKVELARAECKAKDAAEKHAAMTLKLRQAEAEIAKSRGREAAAEAKKAQDDAKAAKADQLRLRAKAEAETERLRLGFAAHLLVRVNTYLRDADAGQERRQRAARSAEKAAKRSAGLERIDPPFFWDAKTAGLRTLTPAGRFTRLRAKAKKEVCWASPDFAFHLFGKDNIGLDEPVVRFRRLIERAMPNYFVVLSARYDLDALLAESNGILDLAFVRANWRYTHVVQSKCYRAGLCEWPPADFGAGGPSVAQPSTAQPSGAQPSGKEHAEFVR